MSKKKPKTPVHPGKILLSEIKARKHTQSELASALGISLPYVNQIIRGRVGISASMALRLEKALGIDAETWMNLQSQYELDEARLKGA